MTNEAGRKDLDLKGRLNKRLAGAGIEIGGGVGTDIATTPLLGMGPVGVAAYSAINAFQGAYTNYHVQKFVNPDEDVNKGEVIASGFYSLIPYMNIPFKPKYAKYLGNANTVKRAVVGGAGISLGGEQLRTAIDEGRMLYPMEAATAIGIGGTVGGALKGIGDKLVPDQSKKKVGNRLMNVLNTQSPATRDARVRREFEDIFRDGPINKVRDKLVKLGLIDIDGNFIGTELDYREVTKQREYWERITKRRVAYWVKHFGGDAKDAKKIFDEETKAWGKQKVAATFLNRYFKALTTELDAEGTKIGELVIGEVDGTARLVKPGSPRSYPYAFEVDHKKAIQNLRQLGIPVGLGANFSDNLEIILAIANRAKNDLGNPALPDRLATMLGYSTSLKEVVGKYFTKKTTDLVPQRFKKAAELVALDNIDQALYDFGIDDTGVFDVAQIDKIVDEQIADAEDYWGLVGPWFDEFEERVPKRIAQESFNDGFGYLYYLPPTEILAELQASGVWKYFRKGKQKKFIREAAEYDRIKAAQAAKEAEAKAKSLKYYIDTYDK